MANSTSWRPQPPSIKDPAQGDADLNYMADEGERPGMDLAEDNDDHIDWLKRAADAYRFSTTYTDANYRSQWEDSLRAFNNQHPGQSKYNSEVFMKRSRLYRPKTRSIIRKNEAAAAAAYFSNTDLVDIRAVNESDQAERISAEVCKALVQYRMTRSIPWFQICVGGVQDAQVQGACVAHTYWRHVELYHKDGLSDILEDRPVIDLVPIENIRIDPSALWTDPINTSPYIIHLMPMYWCDVKERMENPDPKGNRWKKVSAQRAFARTEGADDSTRQARNGVAQEPARQKRDISDYDIVWVHRHIHRYKGEDWEFYTLNSDTLLTEPEPLKNTVWHGKRPYVMGKVMIETHKSLPTPLPIMIKPLQEEANDIQNQRMDNVKLVLNKRWIAKRGKNVDLSSLIRNVPGGVTLADDPEADLKEVNWPDVTQSSYLEQDRIDGDFSDLVGNFNPMQVQAMRTGRESTNTMRMLQGPSNLMTEYMLKTFTETFVEPVIRQLVLLEQHYETDINLFKIAGKKSEAFKKSGQEEAGEALIDKEMAVTVNVGMGATDPVLKMQRFLMGIQSFAGISKIPPPGIDLKEVWKEIAGLSGYADGERFLIQSQDPALMKAQQMIMGLQQKLMKESMTKHNRDSANVVKLRTNAENNQTKLQLEQIKQHNENRRLLTQHMMNLEQQANQPEAVSNE